ncbi:MAG: MFS transporter, partial [Paracoccaceae bacterium]
MKFIYTVAVLSPILASAAFVMELTLVPIVLPLLQTELELTVQELARFYNVYGIAVAIAVLLGGYLGDTLGLLAVYIVGILLFIAGGVILTVAVSELTFIMGRIVQGFGGGLFSPIVPVLLTSILSERPGKILIIWGSVAGIIAAFAPILGGPWISQYGWKTAFYIIAGLSVISLFTLQQKYLQNSNV